MNEYQPPASISENIIQDDINLIDSNNNVTFSDPIEPLDEDNIDIDQLMKDTAESKLSVYKNQDELYFFDLLNKEVPEEFSSIILDVRSLNLFKNKDYKQLIQRSFKGYKNSKNFSRLKADLIHLMAHSNLTFFSFDFCRDANKLVETNKTSFVKKLEVILYIVLYQNRKDFKSIYKQYWFIMSYLARFQDETSVIHLKSTIKYKEIIQDLVSYYFD